MVNVLLLYTYIYSIFFNFFLYVDSDEEYKNISLTWCFYTFVGIEMRMLQEGSFLWKKFFLTKLSIKIKKFLARSIPKLSQM